ncbi:MAG: serine/threonine protein kinase [Archangium sp.]|nr:serine/threonine protein kinase [Archangium sp.]
MADATGVEVQGQLQPGTIIASNYRVISRLSAGGFGTTYLAENTTLAQRVVIKTLHTGTRGAGAEEARMLASLDHPNVVHVYAYDDRYDCIVMQYLAGKTVVDELASIDLVTAIRIGYQAALALSGVHEKGLVHRDVKPENLMMELKAGEVRWLKLIDLGTAMKVGKTIAQPAGTPDYCPPEQFNPDIGASPANDVYALGVTLFLLCSGRFPFSGEPNELAQHHYYSDVPDLAETYRAAYAGKPLDPRLELTLDRVGELVGEMMRKELKKRPDARRVAMRLSEIEHDFSNERTQAGFVMPESGPLQLTSAMRTSTMVLPKRAGKAEPEAGLAQTTSKSLAEAMPPSSGRRGVLIGGAIGVLVLLLGGVWVATRPSEVINPPDPVKDPAPVVKPPPPVAELIDAGVAPVAVAPENEKDAGDDPVPLPNPMVVAKKIDAGSKVKNPVVAAPKCLPDEMWRKTKVKDVRALRERASAQGGAKFLQWEGDELELMKRVNSAQTPADCAAADAQFEKLVAKY